MPRSVDGDARRRELTDAAARLIAKAGIGAVSLRNVAAEAGWSTGALTHYFSGKSDLLLATLRASLDSRRVHRMCTQPGDPWSDLRAGLAVTLPLDEDSRRHWMVTVAFCAEAAGDAALADAQRDAYRHHLRRVAALVEAVMHSAGGRASGDQTSSGGQMSTEPPGGQHAIGKAEWLIALTDGLALQALFDTESWPAPRQLEALDAALRSMGATDLEAPMATVVRGRR